MTKLLDNIPTKEWVHARMHYLGGSELAAAFGKSKYQTPLQLWMIKTGRIEPQGSTPITELGHILEPVIAEKFCQTTGLKVRNISEAYENPDYSFLRGNIDRQIISSKLHDSPGVLEIKTTSSQRLKHEENAYPISWEYQIQWYLFLTGYKYAYLAIMERDTGIFHEPILVQRNQKLIDELFEKAVDWWNKHIFADIPPEPESDTDMLLLFPDCMEGKTLEATPKAYGFYKELCELRDRMDDLEQMEEHLRIQLKQELGDAEQLLCGGKKLISWKSSTQKRLNTPAFKKAFPELYKQFLNQTSTRRFSVY
jgi:putative phage-type endonuclease